VARAVLRALTARRPPTRITVSAHPWGVRVMRWLPDRMLDWLVERKVWKGIRDA
jgi:hypothetical protein